jgi:type IV secretion system protein VirB5
MNTPRRMALSVVLLFATCGVADATMPVIDVAAITKLLQQIMAWDEQLQGMRAQLEQLQQTKSALTGARGMDQVLRLSLADRNYLPGDWAGLASVAAGGGGVDATLTRIARVQREVNAILSDEAIARLPPSLESLLRSERDAIAAEQALTRQAYARSSDRFAALTTLIDEIRAAPDAKAIAELQSRIGAEQTMLTNEHVKLTALAQVSDAQRNARELARREAVIQSHGAFGSRFQAVPPVP